MVRRVSWRVRCGRSFRGRGVGFVSQNLPENCVWIGWMLIVRNVVHTGLYYLPMLLFGSLSAVCWAAEQVWKVAKRAWKIFTLKYWLGLGIWAWWCDGFSLIVFLWLGFIAIGLCVSDRLMCNEHEHPRPLWVMIPLEGLLNIMKCINNSTPFYPHNIVKHDNDVVSKLWTWSSS